MRLVFSISAWLAFCPPSGVMSTQWYLVGFVVALVIASASLRSPAVHSWCSIGIFSRTPPPMDLVRVESSLS